MSTVDRETVQIDTSTETKRRFEEGAKALNLSPRAYFEYLVLRGQPGIDAGRLDRHVREVFAKHGELMRRLAR